MQQEYLIKMVSKHTDEESTDVVEMTSVAEFSGNSDDYVISYTEDEGDRKGCKTTIHVENGACVTITRSGSYGSHMIIEKNQRHLSQHATPFGSFSIGVSALDITSEMDENEGRLSFAYSTDIELRPVGEIEIDITVKKCSK